jgi:hypothetical protein
MEFSRNVKMGGRFAEGFGSHQNELQVNWLVVDYLKCMWEEKMDMLIFSGENAVLTALVRKDAKLGLIFLDMKRTAEEVADLVCWSFFVWQLRWSD